MAKRPAKLSSELVAVKGQAAASATDSVASESKETALLNFRVDKEFRRRFRLRAAQADLKLNELLVQALDAWEEKYLK